jgi:branched-chain amino acid transport system substrate-binding protein
MLNHSFVKVTSVFALLISCTLFSACSKKTEDANVDAKSSTSVPVKGPEVIKIKIGFAAPLTGPQAHLGKDMQNGAEMAIEEINAMNPGVGSSPARFELLVEDDMADPRTATTIAQKFVDKGVSGVIGHLNSGTTIPASKIYNDNGIVQISPSATAIAYTSQGYKNAFRVMANDSQQGKALGNYATASGGMNAQKIAIVDDRTAYGQGLADEFEKAVVANGAVIVVREFTNDKATDFNAILTNIKGKSPDLLFFAGMDKQGALMVRQMRELALKAIFMGGDGIRSEEFIKNAGADAEGVIGSLPGVSFDMMPGGIAFKEKFESKYGAIQVYAPYTYDAVHMMAKAIMLSGSNESAKYQPTLAAMKHTGVTAEISFDQMGDLNGGAVTLYRVGNGQWQTEGVSGSTEAPASTEAVNEAGQVGVEDDFYRSELPPSSETSVEAPITETPQTETPVTEDKN